MSVAHRLNDILDVLDVPLPLFTKVYHAIRCDFAHFFVYEILYHLQLIKRNVCPKHGPMSIDSTPGSELDAFMRKLMTLNVYYSEFCVEYGVEQEETKLGVL